MNPGESVLAEPGHEAATVPPRAGPLCGRLAGVLAAMRFRLRQLLIRPPRVARMLPPLAEQKVMQAFAMVAPGAAQTLLAEIGGLARALHPVQAAGRNGQLDAEVVRVVSSGCEAALDLADLDVSLTGLARQRGRYTGLSSRWLDGLAECERARDQLVQHLLEVLRVLGRARAAGSPAEAVTALRELTEEMEAEVRLRASAAHAVEELLSRSA